MELTIVRPSGQQTFVIVWVELNTALGSFVIQKNHAPMIVPLKGTTSIAFVLKNGKHESIAVTQGIAQVTREKVTIVLAQEE